MSGVRNRKRQFKEGEQETRGESWKEREQTVERGRGKTLGDGDERGMKREKEETGGERERIRVVWREGEQETRWRAGDERDSRQ